MVSNVINVGRFLACLSALVVIQFAAVGIFAAPPGMLAASGTTRDAQFRRRTKSNASDRGPA